MSCLHIYIYFLQFLMSIANVAGSRNENLDARITNQDLALLDNVDEATYQAVMNEIPQLMSLTRRNKKTGQTRFRRSLMRKYAELQDRDLTPAPREPMSVGTVAPGRTPPYPLGGNSTYRTRWPPLENSEERPARRSHSFNIHNYEYYKFYRGRCIFCGMNGTQAPRDSVCHDIYESEDSTIRKLWRMFRVECYHWYHMRHKYIKVRNVWDQSIEYWSFFWPSYTVTSLFPVSDGITREVIYQNTSYGCFKRYLDVGGTYTSRGCRAFRPRKEDGNNFAAHRLQRLEYLTRGFEDICVHSPHASLTPFDRSISLFVRYHVCVCRGNYCNRAPRAATVATAGALLLATLAPHAL